MGKLLSIPAFWYIALPIITAIISTACLKWPVLKKWISPADFQRSIIADRDELQKECDRLAKLNEALFDEVFVLRRVVTVKTKLLDEANADVTRIRTAARRIQATLDNEKIE